MNELQLFTNIYLQNVFRVSKFCENFNGFAMDNEDELVDKFMDLSFVKFQVNEHEGSSQNVYYKLYLSTRMTVYKKYLQNETYMYLYIVHIYIIQLNVSIHIMFEYCIAVVSYLEIFFPV